MDASPCDVYLFIDPAKFRPALPLPDNFVPASEIALERMAVLEGDFVFHAFPQRARAARSIRDKFWAEEVEEV
jgi:hypothetical protein